MQEAQKASALDHQHICTIHEFSETDGGQMFMVMAYYDGETLRQKMQKQSFDVDEMTAMIKQLSEGLSQAHRKGIVHRDIKPANIIFTADGVLKILDFGLAKLAGQERLTKQNSTLGTIAYMAPELLAGDRIDQRVDIWSVGVIMYEMLAGVRPFRGEIEQAVIYSILNEEPDPLSKYRDNLPEYIWRIILKTLEKEPDDRYATIDDLVTDIHSLASPPLKVHNNAKSIVVLPFDDMSSDKDQGYISDGLTEEVIADLSQISELRVISRSSAMAFKDARKDIQKIRRQLDVQYVLEGSVRKSGNQLRITAQLIDAKNDSHLWAEKYTGTLDDIFQIQERVSRSIVEALKVKLGPVEEDKITQRPIPNVHAYECYLRARQYLWYFREDLFKRAERELENALSFTGPNELIYATFGWLYNQYVEAGIQSDVDYIAKSHEYVDKVFALNPESPYGYSLTALLNYRVGDFQSAVTNYKRALALDPNDANSLQMLAYCYTLSGKESAAHPLLDQLLSIDPITPMNSAVYGFMFCMQGRFPEGLVYYKKMYDMSSESPVFRSFYAWVLAMNGEFEKACSVYELVAQDAPNTTFSQLSNAMIAALRAEKEKALSFIDANVLGAAQYVEFLSRLLGEFYAIVDEKEKSIEWWTNAVKLGFCNYHYLKTHCPFLNPIRKEPGFLNVLNNVKVKWENFQV
jgi:serine/threonine protein kinase/Tfp pilus assembly protein PilF